MRRGRDKITAPARSPGQIKERVEVVFGQAKVDPDAIPGAQQRVEYDQQVQIGASDIHGAYIVYTTLRSFQMRLAEAQWRRSCSRR